MDKGAFEEQYRLIYKDMYRFALYTLKHEADAEDAVAEAVVDAWKGLAGLRDEGAFRSWMFKILSIKCKRKQKEYVNKTLPLNESVDLEATFLNSRPGMEEVQDVRAAFWQLNEEERLIISMSVFGGYKSQEIGTMLELKAATVRSKLSRGLEKMQIRLEA